MSSKLGDMRISRETDHRQLALLVEPGAGFLPRLALLRAQFAQVSRRVPAAPRVHRALLANGLYFSKIEQNGKMSSVCNNFICIIKRAADEKKQYTLI